jgi:hypothetical protein
MMLAEAQQEQLAEANGHDWIKTAAATLVFLLEQTDPNTPVLKLWGVFTLRVHHLIRGISAAFGPFTTLPA